jgi:hypothetical protein
MLVIILAVSSAVYKVNISLQFSHIDTNKLQN